MLLKGAFFKCPDVSLIIFIFSIKVILMINKSMYLGLNLSVIIVGFYLIKVIWIKECALLQLNLIYFSRC
jgi:hypothetical protein